MLNISNWNDREREGFIVMMNDYVEVFYLSIMSLCLFTIYQSDRLSFNILIFNGIELLGFFSSTISIIRVGLIIRN